MDIQAISMIQARLALDILLTGTDRRFEPLPRNWIIFYNRPIPNVPASGFLKTVQISLKPRSDCICKGS